MRGELEVTVSVKELLETLKKNCATHVAEFKKMDGMYTGKVIAELKKQLALAESGKEFCLNFHGIIKPQSNEEAYKRAISMLERCTSQDLLMSESNFDKYVNDNWEFKHSFAMTKSFYGME